MGISTRGWHFWEASSHRLLNVQRQELEGQAAGQTQESLCVLPRSLELILRAVGILEEFRQENSIILFVFFVNHCGSRLRWGVIKLWSSGRILPTACFCLKRSVGTQSFVYVLCMAASELQCQG